MIKQLILFAFISSVLCLSMLGCDIGVENQQSKVRGNELQISSPPATIRPVKLRVNFESPTKYEFDITSPSGKIIRNITLGQHVRYPDKWYLSFDVDTSNANYNNDYQGPFLTSDEISGAIGSVLKYADEKNISINDDLIIGFRLKMATPLWHDLVENLKENQLKLPGSALSGRGGLENIIVPFTRNHPYVKRICTLVSNYGYSCDKNISMDHFFRPDVWGLRWRDISRLKDAGLHKNSTVYIGLNRDE